jgi:GNAT superfamily N-acetyltransferase
MIALAETETAIAACFPVMVQLRPHLTAETFVERIRGQQHEGYRLVALTDDAGVVRACAGYRYLHQLSQGFVLYVDDLVTDAASRSNGHGHALMEWLVAEAKGAGCDQLHLDSGTHRHEAHRFYFRERMHIFAYHFSRRLR